MTRRESSGLVSALLVGFSLLAAPAHGQGAGYSYVAYAGPDVSLLSPGEESVAADVHAPIVPGDRLSTGLSSRVEAILADGTVVRVDADSEVRFERLARTYESGDDRTLLALSYGALAVETRATSNVERVVRIDTVDATIVVPTRAYVRVDEGARGTEVRVREGYAEVMGRAGKVTLAAGQTACVKDEEPIDVAEGDLPRDAFTRFLDERRPRRGGESLRYLAQASPVGGADDWSNEEASIYEAALMDEAGTWIFVPSYGRYCFRPRVPADWRPYASGYWRSTPSGMTWVAYEPWGWLPSHFGTWVFDAVYGWLWIPDWVYSPAWVFWSFTPSWVGWCPIGFYGGNDSWSGDGGIVDGRFEPGRWAFLRGRIEVAKIDPRGWSFAAAGRIGTRLERGDIARADRVSFRKGETAVISAERLRVERTSDRPLRAVVLEAVSRAAASAPRDADAGLAAILRRDPVLPREARETLQRSGAAGRGEVEAPAPRNPGPWRVEPLVAAEPARGGSASRSEAIVAPPRAEPQRIEAPRVDTQRVEAQRVEAQRAEAQRAEAQRAEAQRVETQRFEAQRAEAQRAEAERAEAQRVEAQRVETQRAEAQRAEAQRAEAQRAEAQRAEAQRAEAQRAEAQRSEPPPRSEPPQAEPPRFEPQRSEPSRSEPPPAPRAEPEAPRSEHRG